MPDYHPDKLLALARQLLPADPSLTEEVELATENPSAYVNAFRERLAQRGINSPVPELPLLALIDGLAARQHLVEIDWKEAPAGVAWNIDPLRNAPQDDDLWDWMDAEYPADSPTDEFLKAVADRLMARHRLVLASLDANTDSYPLFLIESAQFPVCRQLAQHSGYCDLINRAEA